MLIPYLIHHLVGVILGVLLLLLLIFSSSAIEGMFENDDKESKELAKDVVGFLTIALILGLGEMKFNNKIDFTIELSLFHLQLLQYFS